MTTSNIPIHPAAELFPMMTDDEFTGLKKDIDLHGCKEPIYIWQDQLLDGRNRLKACDQLGIQPEQYILDDDTDPWEFVISSNLHRRHLTTGQRAMVAAKIAQRKRGENQHSQEDGQNRPTTKQAAKTLNVSPTSVKEAKQVMAEGSEELVEAVERGEVPVSKAAKAAKSAPKEQQLEKAKEKKPANKSEKKSAPQESVHVGKSIEVQPVEPDPPEKEPTVAEQRAKFDLDKAVDRLYDFLRTELFRWPKKDRKTAAEHIQIILTEEFQIPAGKAD